MGQRNKSWNFDMNNNEETIQYNLLNVVESKRRGQYISEDGQKNRNIEKYIIKLLAQEELENKRQNKLKENNDKSKIKSKYSTKRKATII